MYWTASLTHKYTHSHTSICTLHISICTLRATLLILRDTRIRSFCTLRNVPYKRSDFISIQNTIFELYLSKCTLSKSSFRNVPYREVPFEMYPIGKFLSFCTFDMFWHNVHWVLKFISPLLSMIIQLPKHLASFCSLWDLYP